MKKSYKITVDCAACAAKMERLAASVKGVTEVSISFMAQKITVEFADGADARAVMTEILAVCRKVERRVTIAF